MFGKIIGVPMHDLQIFVFGLHTLHILHYLFCTFLQYVPNHSNLTKNYLIVGHVCSCLQGLELFKQLENPNMESKFTS